MRNSPTTRRATLRLALLLAAAAAAAPRAEPPAEPAAAAPSEHYAEVARRLARVLPAKHLTHSSLDDTVSARAWTNYLATLDYEHVFFLQSDVNRFAEQVTTLDDGLAAGNVTFAFTVFDVFKERMRDRCAYIEQLLQKGFDLDRREYYTVRKRETPWPRDQADWDEIWRRKIKNEYIRLRVAQELGEDTELSTNAPPVAVVTNAAVTIFTPLAPPPATNAAPGPNETVPLDNAGPNGAGAVAGPAAETNAPPAGKPPTPEETIAERYKQALTVIADSDAEWVMQRYLSAFTQAYDPHSGYMSPSAVEDFDIEMKLSLVGIGALLRAEDGAAKIVRLIPGGPADRDKRDIRLQPGDKIIAVGEGDGRLVPTLHWPLPRVVRLIRGEKGTRVVLLVVSASDPSGSSTRRVDLWRDEVKLEEQAASWRLRRCKAAGGEVRRLAVIRVPAFYANLQARSQRDPDFRSAAYDVARALQEAQAKDIAGVILDLRNNGGGSLLEAIRMTGLFIRTGPTVMVRERDQLRVLPDMDPSVAYAGPLVVLVNRLSASASEIVAGALQDYGRAVIVGDSKTHGKGSVQTIVELGDDDSFGSVKVTTASYYRISGSSTQLRGVTSDVVVPSPYDYMELGEEYLPNAIEWSAVQRARYYPVDDLRETVALLRRRSEDRRQGDERFAAYGCLLERVDAMNKSREVPLNLEERRKLAAAERDIARLQRELAPDDEDVPPDGGGGAEDEAKEDNDIVLDEALRILSDEIDIQRQRAQQDAETGGVERRSVAQSIAEWLRKNL